MSKYTQKECRCWNGYPNPMRKEKCCFYECVKEGNKLTRKTVCKLKNDRECPKMTELKENKQ